MRRVQTLSPYPKTPDRRVTEKETAPSPDWVDGAVSRFLAALGDLTKLIEDTSHRVNEYQVQGLLSPEGNNFTIQVTPDYEVPEIIESVIVTGPPATAYTLQLGKRQWDLTMPASGIQVIAPVKLSLDRDDQRIVTSSTAGNWTLELCGYADFRYTWK